ncbi:NAD(P)H-dependent oxidoreductase [Gaetbulibacter sp. M240]|uniref:NAD(P)H-dependent oxidoreductase n=1 Tax=Gaetbulibacter sp. M240 TaxID=3126511 RepID=UPI00374E75AD
MNTIQQLQWRYATKKFDPNKILSQEKINILKEAFNLTATSYGLQTISMVVVQDQALREQLWPHAYNQEQVLHASHLLVICIQKEIVAQDVVDFFNNIKDIRNTDENILNPYRENLIQTIQKQSLIEQQQWSTNQAYIALGNLMTVCAIENIDSCPMEGFNPEKFDSILNLGERGLKSVLLLPVGYRASDDMFSDFKKVRKPIHETIIEI